MTAPTSTLMIAYKAGACATCRGTIAKGAQFDWGRERGTRVCVPCSTGQQPEHTQPISAAPVTTAREWSIYQRAIIDFATGSDRSGMVYAVAGSGKTTVVEEFCRHLPQTLRVRYVVFNKKNAVEAQTRMPSNVEASTFHSACWSALSRTLGRPQIDSNKTLKLIDKVITDKVENRKWASTISRLVGLGKNSGLDALPDAPVTQQAWMEIIDHHAIDIDVADLSYDEIPRMYKRVCDWCTEVLAASKRETSTVDFDDMLWLTLALDVSLVQYDVVCVDEAQDTNAVQRALLHKMVKADGRVIAVGDPRQAIYGFRGADANAMDIIREQFDAVELPLSINYRCSKAVVEYAQSYCPQLEAWEKAPAGSVEWLDSLDVNDIAETSAVLCRNTAPLIQLAMRMLRAGKGCKVLGRDIGQGLVKLVNQIAKHHPGSSLADFAGYLHDWAIEQAEIAKRRKKAELVQSIVDKADSIQYVLTSLPTGSTIEDLTHKIAGIFSDDVHASLTTLCTVHKSKGLEFPTVYILDPGLMPSKYARQPWQQEQEINLMYVAYTRAQVDLRFISSEMIS